MKPVGWAKLLGTAIMIARRCAILPTRSSREIQELPHPLIPADAGIQTLPNCKNFQWAKAESPRPRGRTENGAPSFDNSRTRPLVGDAPCRVIGPYVALPTLLIAAIITADPAGAETIEEFYRGKTITMYVGTGVGGGAVSAYPMALAPVIKKYIPGHPNLVVSYMPGAGGIKAASYIYGIAPQDGTAWGFIPRGLLLAPLLK